MQALRFSFIGALALLTCGACAIAENGALQERAAPPRAARHERSADLLLHSEGVIDLTAHSQIEIARSVDVVWPHILNSNPWTTLRLDHRGGSPGEVGEIFAVIDPARPQRLRTLFAAAIEITPNLRRTLRFYDAAGAQGGFVIWTLRNGGRSTIVSYDIYFRSALSAESKVSCEPGCSNVRSAGQAAMQARADEQLGALKRIVEVQ